MDKLCEGALVMALSIIFGCLPDVALTDRALELTQPNKVLESHESDIDMLDI